MQGLAVSGKHTYTTPADTASSCRTQLWRGSWPKNYMPSAGTIDLVCGSARAADCICARNAASAARQAKMPHLPLPLPSLRTREAAFVHSSCSAWSMQAEHPAETGHCLPCTRQGTEMMTGFCNPLEDLPWTCR